METSWEAVGLRQGMAGGCVVQTPCSSPQGKLHIFRATDTIG